MCKKSGGLSNRDIDILFKQVLLHPSFKFEDISIKSAIDVENYKKSFYSEVDGWQTKEIDGYTLQFRDPITALKVLFASPKVEQKICMAPAAEDSNPKVYSSPQTGDWWRSMQVCFPKHCSK